METPQHLSLARPPIVEAVLDIDCDMPSDFNVVSITDRAKAAFSDDYPLGKKGMIQQLQFGGVGAQPIAVSSAPTLQVLRFFQHDEKQLIQIRADGFSFNRLAPYPGMDMLKDELRRTWDEFVRLTKPLQVRTVRLRFINRIQLPLTNGKVDTDDFLQCGPRLADEQRLVLVGWLNQNVVVDTRTNSLITTVMSLEPAVADAIPLIFDIRTERNVGLEPNDWLALDACIESLRDLKNMIFKNSLTAKCLALFQ